ARSVPAACPMLRSSPGTGSAHIPRRVEISLILWSYPAATVTARSRGRASDPLVPGDAVGRRLGERAHGDQVEVHVVRGAQGVGDDVGAVLGGQRPLDPVVDGVGRLLVAEADEGELLGADHAGGDLDDPDLLAVELQAEGAGEHVLARLRGVVSGAA